ncbi:hypothetical protein R1flu_025425 [Riccia fluitans]|uniref:Uncharacterized protein n=1 Tax=Riccia fluitans TaxID=41844 RepID=A0ABD1XXQ4_9MARC
MLAREGQDVRRIQERATGVRRSPPVRRGGQDPDGIGTRSIKAGTNPTREPGSKDKPRKDKLLDNGPRRRKDKLFDSDDLTQ